MKDILKIYNWGLFKSKYGLLFLPIIAFIVITLIGGELFAVCWGIFVFIIANIGMISHYKKLVKSGFFERQKKKK